MNNLDEFDKKIFKIAKLGIAAVILFWLLVAGGGVWLVIWAINKSTG